MESFIFQFGGQGNYDGVTLLGLDLLKLWNKHGVSEKKILNMYMILMYMTLDKGFDFLKKNPPCKISMMLIF